MSYLTEEQIKTIDDASLIECYLNARKTWYGAGGHNKANMNRRATEEYGEELIKRLGESKLAEIAEQKTPDGQMLGSFNGMGAC